MLVAAKLQKPVNDQQSSLRKHSRYSSATQAFIWGRSRTVWVLLGNLMILQVAVVAIIVIFYIIVVLLLFFFFDKDTIQAHGSKSSKCKVSMISMRSVALKAYLSIIRYQVFSYNQICIQDCRMGFIHHQPLPQLRNHFNLFLFQPFNCFPPTKITNLVAVGLLQV